MDENEGGDVGFWERAVLLEGLKYRKETKPTVIQDEAPVHTKLLV